MLLIRWEFNKWESDTFTNENSSSEPSMCRFVFAAECCTSFMNIKRRMLLFYHIFKIIMIPAITKIVFMSFAKGHLDVFFILFKCMPKVNFAPSKTTELCIPLTFEHMKCLSVHLRWTCISCFICFDAPQWNAWGASQHFLQSDYTNPWKWVFFFLPLALPWDIMLGAGEHICNTYISFNYWN